MNTKGPNMETTYFGAMANYTRGWKHGKRDADAGRNFADLSGVNNYYKDGYAVGYRS